MTSADQVAPPSETQLSQLYSAVTQARSEYRVARNRLDRKVDQQARARLVLEALQTYADAATKRGIPIPYRYRDELRLFEAMANNVSTGRESV